MKDAEVIAFATPIYFYEMCGQMKTLLDRSNPLFPSDYAFRDIYLLATAADSAESSMDGAVKGLGGWIACFEKAALRGVVRGTGADGAGTILQVPAALKSAFERGNKAYAHERETNHAARPPAAPEAMPVAYGGPPPDGTGGTSPPFRSGR